LTAQSPFRTGAVKLSILGTTVSLITVLMFYWTAGMTIRWGIAAAMLAVILLLAGCLAGSLRSFALIGRAGSDRRLHCISADAAALLRPTWSGIPIWSSR